jgi:hypothetical protein
LTTNIPAAGLCYNPSVSDRRQRRAHRRAEWDWQVVPLGESKGSLYELLSHAERVAAMTRLNVRIWKAAGVPISQTSRSQWPGEIFEILCRD